MLKLLSLFFALFLLHTAGSPAFALTHGEFLKAAEKFANNKISREAFDEICNDALAKDAADDKEYAADIHAYKAILAVAEGKIKEALPSIIRALEADSTNPLVYAACFDLFTRQKNPAEAQNALEHAIIFAKNPIQHDIWVDLAKRQSWPLPLQTPVMLWGEYEKNDTVANVKYAGKEVTLHGRIDKISSYSDGHYTIQLVGDSSMFGRVLCGFSKEHAEGIAKLSEGQFVVIKGICQDKQFKQLKVDECRLDINAMQTLADASRILAPLSEIARLDEKIDEIWRAFESNSLAAQETHVGKSFTFRGTVVSIANTPEGEPAALLQGQKIHALCIFDPADKGQLLQLKKGDDAMFTARSAGLAKNGKDILFDSCKVMP